MATSQMLNGLINSNEVVPMAQIESIKEGLTQNKLLDGHNAALLDILAKRHDETPAAETARKVLLAAEGSGIVTEGALRRATAGNPEAFIKASNEAAAQLNRNPHWKLAKNNNISLVKGMHKSWGDAPVTTSIEFNNAVDTLNKMWFDDVVRYAAEPGKGMQYAYNQANANFKALETAVKADPFGNHILKLNDLSKNPKGGIFVKDFGVTDDIQPTRAISYTQLSGTFQSLGTNVKGYDREAAKKELIDNPDAFDYIETDVITDFVNKMQDANQAPSYASIGLFDKVAVKAGYTNGYAAAKDMLKSRGITLESNPADARTEQLFKQYGLIGVQQMGGVGNAYNLSQGLPQVRGTEYISDIDRDRQDTGRDVVFRNPEIRVPENYKFTWKSKGTDGLPSVGVDGTVDPSLGPSGKGFGHYGAYYYTSPRDGREYEVLLGHGKGPSYRGRVEGETIPTGTLLQTMGNTGRSVSGDHTSIHINGVGFTASDAELMALIKDLGGVK